MKITRDGKEYELTPQELREAFYEQQKLNHNEDVVYYYENIEDERCYWSEEKVSQIAERALDILDDDDNYWESYSEAFTTAVQEEIRKNENNKIIK